MAKPAHVIPSKCIGYKLAEETKSHTKRDVMLYALGLGVSQDPTDMKDLRFTYENADGFAALPSFCVVFPSMEEMFSSLLSCPGLPAFNPMMLLHGEQRIQLRRPIDTEATLRHTSTIKDVQDKGKGALVIIQVQSTDLASDEVVCLQECNLFIRGIGGFGGDQRRAGRQREAMNAFPQRPADVSFRKVISGNQALVYRLSGDYNPLHADPAMAAMGGFDQPILHGLCTFGIATHAVVKEICENDPTSVKAVEGRFSSPVCPQHELRVDMWKEGSNHVYFQVVNENTGKVCLANGRAHLNTAAANRSFM